jgi:lysophospholipase L1-like esterase
MRTAGLLALALLTAWFLPGEAVGAEGSQPLGRFFQALSDAEASASTRLVRIGWWGDSAIVGDGYTGRLRERLQAKFGDGGPGFILAAPDFEGYLRQGVRLLRNNWTVESVIQGDRRNGHYGYGGVVSSSFGGASSTFESTGKPFTVVEVFYRSTAASGVLQTYLDQKGSPAASQPTKLEAWGEGRWRYEIPGPGSTWVRVRAAGQGPVSVYGVALERKGPGVVLDALGILGIRARRYVQYMDRAHMAEQVRLRGLDLVVINFGGNERVDGDLSVGKHTKDLGDALALLRAGAPQAACMVVGPLAHGSKVKGKLVTDPRLGIIYEAQRKVAAQAGCQFFDSLEAMGGAQAVLRYKQLGGLGADLAHLNAKGHKAVGDAMAEWLLGQYAAWKTAQVAVTPPPTAPPAPVP